MVVVFFRFDAKVRCHEGKGKKSVHFVHFFLSEKANCFRALLILRGGDFLSFMFQNVFITA